MKVSVVLSAYNGEKFILEQLDSIRVQSVPVNEVIILDDCSTDNTVKICKDFISKYNLSNWYIEINTKNKGFVQNFYYGFQKATGDIIFICDQDDRWRSNKVERIKHFFTLYPDALSISSSFSRFCGTHILDTHVTTPHYKKKQIKRINFSEFCQFHWYLGMATAFRKEILKYNYSDCIINIPYDISVNLIACIHSGLYYVDEVLVERRSYPNSTSNRIALEWTTKQFGGDKILYSIYRQNLNLKAFSDFISTYSPNENYMNIIDAYICANNKRFNYLNNKLLIQWILNLRTIIKLFTIRTYVKDGLLLLKCR